MQKKTFDPRCSKVNNPFVQAYIEKQEVKSKPIGDRQKIVNILFGAVLVMNVAVLSMVIWSQRSSIMPEITGAVQADTTMGEAMLKLKQLEVNLQNMRTCVEFHKNAYFKLEQEHETMKAALARTVPADNQKDVSSNYPTPTALVTAVNAEVVAPVPSVVRETTVAAQLAPTANGQ